MPTPPKKTMGTPSPHKRMPSLERSVSVTVPVLTPAEARAPVNSPIEKDKFKRTKLMVAASTGDVVLIRSLVEQGAHINAGNFNGNTALMWAASQGRLAAVKLLLELRAEIHARNAHGWTALMCAAHFGHLDCLNALVEAGSNVHDRDHHGLQALHLAAHSDHAAALQPLVNAGADINSQDNKGQTALMWASYMGHLGTVRQLISMQASLVLTDRYRQIALHLAAEEGFPAVVRALAQAGIPLNAADRFGYTAMMLATANNHHAVIETLIELHADVNARRNDGCTALHVAAYRGRGTIASMLLKAGANARLTDIHGLTPLSTTAHAGHAHMVKILIDGGCDPNEARHDGSTPIMLAAYRGHSKTLRALLDCKANPTIARADFSTTLMLAAMSGHLPVVKMLISSLLTWRDKMLEAMPALPPIPSPADAAVSAVAVAAAPAEVKEVTSPRISPVKMVPVEKPSPYATLTAPSSHFSSASSTTSPSKMHSPRVPPVVVPNTALDAIPETNMERNISDNGSSSSNLLDRAPSTEPQPEPESTPLKGKEADSSVDTVDLLGLDAFASPIIPRESSAPVSPLQIDPSAIVVDALTPEAPKAPPSPEFKFTEDPFAMPVRIDKPVSAGEDKGDSDDDDDDDDDDDAPKKKGPAFIPDSSPKVSTSPGLIPRLFSRITGKDTGAGLEAGLVEMDGVGKRESADDAAGADTVVKLEVAAETEDEAHTPPLEPLRSEDINGQGFHLDFPIIDDAENRGGMDSEDYDPELESPVRHRTQVILAPVPSPKAPKDVPASASNKTPRKIAAATVARTSSSRDSRDRRGSGDDGPLSAREKNADSDSVLQRTLVRDDPINWQQKDGLTALMLAASMGRPGVVRALLEIEADKELRDKDGNTAIDLAKMFKRRKCAKLLKKGVKKPGRKLPRCCYLM